MTNSGVESRDSLYKSVYQPSDTRALLGRVAPLRQPRSVYKSNVECSFLNRNDGQINDLEGQGRWPLFSLIVERIPRCIFGANLVILAQIFDDLSHGQAKFPKILSQNGQNNLEGHGQWPPFSIPAESIPGCMFGANLVILAQICDDLSCGQAKFPKILSLNGQNDLEGQGQWPPFSLPAKSILGCMFGANLVILAQICDDLSCGQAKFPKILSLNGQNDLEGQGQWPPFSLPAKSILGCMFGANLVILAQICDDLSCGQAKFPKILRLNGQNDLEGQGQWPPFSLPAKSILGCMFGANLVILAQICGNLSCGQAKFPKILRLNGQNDLEGQGQWPPFSLPAKSIPGCMFDANLVILAQICDDLSHGQSELPRILSQNGQNDLEDQGQWPPFSIPAESIPGHMFGANLVIPAQTCDELSCGQGKVYGRTDRRTDGRTDGRTDAGNNNTPSAWEAKG